MGNKAITKHKLINAVGDIVNKCGFEGLGVNKVALKAGRSKVLIYRYFGSFDELIKSYILENSFWLGCVGDQQITPHSVISLHDQVCTLLQTNAATFYAHCEMEMMLINGAGSSHSDKKHKLLHKRPANQGMPFDVMSVLIAAATEHLLFNSQVHAYVDADGRSSDPKSSILRSMEQIIGWSLG